MITCDLGAYHMRSRQAVMEAVCVLMGMKPEWGEAKKLLNDMNFLDTLQQYDKDNIEEKRVKGYDYTSANFLSLITMPRRFTYH